MANKVPRQDSFSFRKMGNVSEPLDPDSCGELLVNESDSGLDFQDSCEFNRNDPLRALFISTILEPDRGAERSAFRHKRDTKPRASSFASRSNKSNVSPNSRSFSYAKGASGRPDIFNRSYSDLPSA